MKFALAAFVTLLATAAVAQEAPPPPSVPAPPVLPATPVDTGTPAATTPGAAKQADASKPIGPCQHGPSTIMMGNFDPVEQRCQLSVAVNALTSAIVQNLMLSAHAQVLQNDADAAKAASASAVEAKPAP